MTNQTDIKPVLLACALVCNINPVAAEIEEIIVTAQKTAQSIQDIPISVSAIQGEQLTVQGITDIFDLQQSAPGLTVQQNQNATTSNFSLRGVGTSGSNFGLESSVGLYVDGVYRARQSSMINEMVDMERVEVVRGPQGTLFGRNSSAGAILMHTKAPDHEFDAYINAGIGNFNQKTLNGAVGGSLAENTLAYRLTGFGSYRDGYVDDVSFGKEKINDRDREGFRLQFLYTPSDTLSARVIVDHSEINEVCCASVTKRNNYMVFPRNNLTGQFATTATFGTDSIITIPSFVNIPGTPIPGFGATVIDQSRVFDDVVAFNVLPESQSQDQGVSVEVNKETSNGILTSITALRKYETDDVFDVDFTSIDISSRDEHAEQESFSQEFRFAGNFDRGNFVVGAYYFQQDYDTLSNTTHGEDLNNFVSLSVFSEASGLADQAAQAAMAGDFAAAAAFAQAAQFNAEIATAIFAGLENVPLTPGNPLLPLQMAGFTGTGFPATGIGSNNIQQQHKAWAIFGQLDYELTDHLILTVGARYTWEDKTIEGLFTEPGSSWGTLLGLPDLTVINPRSNLDDSLKDEQLTGNIKLSWFESDNRLFYASFTTGYKSGGTNTDRINEAFDPIFDAENALTFELGMKADFPEQNARLNIALHHSITEDYQSNAFAGAGFNLTNAGEIVATGAEIESWWQPTDGLQLAAAYVYNKAEYKDFDKANCWVANSWLTGVQDPGRAQPTDGFCNRSEDPLGLNPEHTFILSATQSFIVSETVEGFVHANYNYRTSQYKDENIDPLKKIDGYGILNTRIGINLLPLELEIAAWARNLLDEDYLATHTDAPLQFGKLNAYPTEPRTYGLSLTKYF